MSVVRSLSKWRQTKVSESIGLKYPLIQAPMAGSVTPNLVATVSNCGALGSYPCGYQDPDKIQQDVQEILKLTNRPVNFNVFVGNAPQVTEAVQEKISKMNTFLNEDVRKRLGIPLKREEDFKWIEPVKLFESQCEVILNTVPLSPVKHVFSFTFGIPPKKILNQFKERGFYTIGTATTVSEAISLKESGVDAIVAQGSEAGGHRGTFLPYRRIEDVAIGTMALVPMMVEAVHPVPVIAAGGIMNGKGILAAMSLGASATQLGTAFLTTHESGSHPLFKKLLLGYQPDDVTKLPSVITNSFSGKPARGLRNELLALIEDRFAREDIPPYPIQHVLTVDIRSASYQLGTAQYATPLCGQGVPLCRDISVTDLIADLEREINE